MQKEPTKKSAVLAPAPEQMLDQATPKQNAENHSGGTEQTEPVQTERPGEPEDPGCAADSQRFDELIKGPYKEAFAAKVQGIINKRFKELKTKQAEAESAAENRGTSNETRQTSSGTEADAPEHTASDLPPTAAEYEGIHLAEELKNPTFAALIHGGVDVQTAYNAIHFDEIMDGSVRYGASMAAKQLADSIRFKASRPAENGLSDRGGFAARRGAAGLTPEKRRELARKALMGEEIGF